MAVVWEVHYFLSEVIDMAAGDAESKKKKKRKKPPNQLKEKHTSLALQLKPLKKIPPD